MNRALNGMKSGKVWHYRRVNRDIIENGEISEEWKSSVAVLIHKGKGDVLNFGKHRGKRLLEHGMKLFENVLEKRLRKLIRWMINSLVFAHEDQQ